MSKKLKGITIYLTQDDLEIIHAGLCMLEADSNDDYHTEIGIVGKKLIRKNTQTNLAFYMNNSKTKGRLK